MSNRNFLLQIILFFIGGLVAGFVSLVFSVIADFVIPEYGRFFPIFILVLVEEFTKLFALALLIAYQKAWTSARNWQCFLAALFFGAGFGIFELSLIFLSVGSVPNSAFTVAFIHMTTSIFLFFAIYAIKTKGKESLGYFLFLLAVLIHLWYNTFVISIAS